MAHFKSRHRPSNKKRKRSKKRSSKPAAQKTQTYLCTGEEAIYLRSLVDSGAMVMVVLNTGEQIPGYVRYYDRDFFSLGPADGGPKLFLRKNSVRYLYEVAEQSRQIASA